MQIMGTPFYKGLLQKYFLSITCLLLLRSVFYLITVMCARTIVSIFSFLSPSLIDLYSRRGGLVSCEGSELNLSVGFFFNAYAKSSYLLLGFFKNFSVVHEISWCEVR